jgi:two-component system cell cycle sensor histidine kinase/response regulator CckA
MGVMALPDVLRVLLVEDSASDAELVLRELERIGRPLESRIVETEDAMRAALEREDWDLVISDWSMPKFSAAAALDVMKEMALDLPFIIVSGTVGEETAVAAMRAGAQDYVLKDKLGRLTPAVERELREREHRDALRQSENALRASEARFARLDESGILGMVLGDLSGNVIEANGAFLRMVGFSREELVEGKVRWRDLTPPEWQAATQRGIEELSARGVATPYEKEYVRKDGSRVAVLVGIAMVAESRSIAFMVDISAQKRAEEGLRRSEEQLRQVQKMEAVSRLAGGVAHDFNNVLSVIMSYGEIILGDLKPPNPMRADVEEIRKAAARAAGLTRQLLMLSRQQVIEPRVIDLFDVLTGLEKMLQRVLGEDVELVLVAPKAVGRVKVDPSHMEQVILNLVVNARDAMPKGGKLTIETSNVDLDETSTTTTTTTTRRARSPGRPARTW